MVMREYRLWSVSSPPSSPGLGGSGVPRRRVRQIDPHAAQDGLVFGYVEEKGTHRALALELREPLLKEGLEGIREEMERLLGYLDVGREGATLHPCPRVQGVPCGPTSWEQ